MHAGFWCCNAPESLLMSQPLKHLVASKFLPGCFFALVSVFVCVPMPGFIF